jgi:hypothetical protein
MWPSNRNSDDSRLRQSHFDRCANNAVFRALILAAAIAGLSTDFACADETGVSLWVPGFFGSLAAAPQTPGFVLAISSMRHRSVREEASSFRGR